MTEIRGPSRRGGGRFRELSRRSSAAFQFTDFTDAGFCPFVLEIVLEIFTLGITTGTTPTRRIPSWNPPSSMTEA